MDEFLKCCGYAIVILAGGIAYYLYILRHLINMEHTRYKCPKPCTVEHCPFCDGGLFQCTECGLAEGELTTECPGFKVDMDTASKCYAEKLDFINGDWVEL